MLKQRVIRKLIEEWTLFAVLAGWILTSILLRRFPEYEYTDLKVIYTLLVFLVIVKGLENSGYLKHLAFKAEKGRFLIPKLVAMTTVLSMIVTNDIALLTMVPFTLAIDTGNPVFVITMETIAANVASSISPVGNPQNIFIYHHYNLGFLDFVSSIYLFSVPLTAAVLILSFRKISRKIEKRRSDIKFGKRAYLYLFFLILFMMVILRVLPIWVGVIPLIYAALFDRNSLKIDYIFLMIFALFFGFTDNISHMIRIDHLGCDEVFLYSSLSSQIMSNVPSALLFADFISEWKPLLWGVSVGGTGTLFASLANLITYRFYHMKFGKTRDFLLQFHFYNICFFIAGIAMYFVISPIILK